MKIRNIFVSIFIISISIYLTSAAYAELAVLQAASFQDKAVSFAKPFYRWVREANERCSGQVVINVSGPGEIPSNVQWYALKNGDVDMYYGPANYYRGALPEADVFNLAHNGPAEQRGNGAWKVLNSLHNERLNAWYLTSLGAGVKFFVYTTKPAEAGSFVGLRLRGVPLYEGFLRSLGAEPVYMPASEVYAALKKQYISGYGWPLWSSGLDWEHFVRFRYGPGFLNAASPILVNLDKWNSLEDSQRQCLTQASIWAEAEWPKWRKEEGAQQMTLQQNADIEYVDLGPEFAKKAEDMYWAMLEKAQPEFVQSIKPLLMPTE